jgi:hypothetical protein
MKSQQQGNKQPKPTPSSYSKVVYSLPFTSYVYQRSWTYRILTGIFAGVYTLTLLLSVNSQTGRKSAIVFVVGIICYIIAVMITDYIFYRKAKK